MVSLPTRTNKKVAVCRTELLPLSETFIKEQMLAFNDWQGLLVGEQVLEGGLPLDGLKYHLYKKARQSIFAQQFQRIHNALNLPSGSLIRLLKKLAPDLIHVHFGTDATWLWPSIKQLQTPLVVTLHGYDITTYKSFWKSHLNPKFRFYPERLVAMAQDPRVHFIAVSEAIRQRAMEFGLPAEKITVKYIGIDTGKFKPGPIPINERGQRILFVGRLTEVKGTIFLLRAFKRVSHKMPSAKLVIVGSGEDEDALKSFARKNDLPVKFTGALSHSKVLSEFQKAQVFCLPIITTRRANFEAFALFLLEAQVCGVPVVTSAHGGATEGILHGETGFAFTEKDVQALSQYLIQLLSDDELLCSMSDRAQRFVREKFDLKQCTADLEAYYDDIDGQFLLAKGQ